MDLQNESSPSAKRFDRAVEDVRQARFFLYIVDA